MKYALVTGAAKGIGKAIAIELAARDYHLLLVDMDELALQTASKEIAQKYGVSVAVLCHNLAHQDTAEKIREWTKPYHQSLTVVVNNAGYGLNGSFCELTLEEQLDMIDVNIKAQVSLSYIFISILRNAKKSYLLNVCSTTAFQPVPYMNIYAASKAFILSFNRSLRYELRNSNIVVSYLIPGATDTDFVKRARMQDHTLKMASRFNMSPTSVAVVAINGTFKEKAAIIPGFSNKLNAFLPKFVPLALVMRIASSIYGPRKKVPTGILTQTAHLRPKQLNQH